MRRPGFAANERIELPRLGLVLPAELSAARDRVESWGGDPTLFHRLLAPLLHLEAAQLRDAAVVAAWRAGVVRMRDAALESVARLPEHAAASALALETHELAPFRAGQATSRYAHPRLDDTIALVGGFTGLGGRLRHRPTQVRFVHDGVAFRHGDEIRHVELDVFGAAWTTVRPDAADADVNGFPPELAPVTVPGFTAMGSVSSYLVTVRRAP